MRIAGKVAKMSNDAFGHVGGEGLGPRTVWLAACKYGSWAKTQLDWAGRLLATVPPERLSSRRRTGGDHRLGRLRHQPCAVVAIGGSGLCSERPACHYLCAAALA